MCINPTQKKLNGHGVRPWPAVVGHALQLISKCPMTDRYIPLWMPLYMYMLSPLPRILLHFSSPMLATLSLLQFYLEVIRINLFSFSFLPVVMQ